MNNKPNQNNKPNPPPRQPATRVQPNVNLNQSSAPLMDEESQRPNPRTMNDSSARALIEEQKTVDPERQLTVTQQKQMSQTLRNPNVSSNEQLRQNESQSNSSQVEDLIMKKTPTGQLRTPAHMEPISANRTEALDEEGPAYGLVQKQIMAPTAIGQVTPLGAPSTQTPTPGAIEQGSGDIVNMEWWPMRIGEQEGKAKDDLAGMNDNDVFPMSVEYTRWDRFVMTTTRFVTLFALFFLFVPIDLYVTSVHKRLGYFGTDYYKQTIMFSDINSGPNSTFSFTLQGCRSYWYPLDGGYNDRMVLEYSFLYKTPFSQTNNGLEIDHEISSSACIVNVYFPTSGSIPFINYTFTGDMASEIDDSALNGTTLNFSNGLSINGDVCHLNLNNHNISSLNVNLKLSYAYLNTLVAPKKVIYIQTGLVSDYIPTQYAKNLYYLNQSSGLICVYSQLQSIDYSRCSSPSTNHSCTVTAAVCTNSATTCDQTSPQSTSNITLLDGPIQVRYSQDAFIANKKGVVSQTSWQPAGASSSITFSDASLTALNSSLQQYNKNYDIDRVSVFQIFGSEYQRTWAYTNKNVFFQSQYWPIIWASVTLLQPTLDINKISMIDSTCPGRDLSLLPYIDSDINDYFLNYYPNVQTSDVALVSGYSQFFRIFKDEEGNVFYNQIQINENQLLIAAFGVSAAIGLVGALLMVQIMVMLFKILTKRYSEWIQAQRAFAITKRQFEVSQEKGGSFEESVKFELQSKQNILEVRGLWSTNLRPMTQEDIKKGHKFSFSIFQLPTLAIDYTLRQNADSLKMYLLKVPQNKQFFSPIRMKGPQKRVSMSLKEFQKKYADFCIKQGYIEIDIEAEGLETFEIFGIKLDNQLGQELPAYGNIRFKTMKEKSVKTLQGEKSDSLIDQFLHEECVASTFPTDYILYTEIANAFNSYCDRAGIEPSQRENIIGSEALAMFGAVKKDVPPPYYLVGVKEAPSEDKNSENITGLIRIPSGRKANWMTGLLASDGVIANVAMTMIHFAIILAIPIITPVISFFAVSAMTQIQEDVLAIPVSFFDFYMANKINPWWSNVPHVDIFLYIQISVVVFVVLGLLELASFYLTGLKNQGKHAIAYTWPKKILSTLFKIVLCIFLFSYFMYMWFGLVWAILAAIINPTQFLPYATASITFMTVVGTKLAYIRSQYQKVLKNFDKILAEKLNLIVESAIAKLKVLTKDALDQVKVPLGNDTFHKEINSHFDKVFDNASKTMVEMARDGNLTTTQALSKIASNALDGLQGTVIELCIGVITKNIVQIESALKKLSVELNIDYGLLESIVEIVLNDYNPDMEGQDEKLGQAEIQIKKLFRKLIPTMDVEPIGELLYILIRGDVSRLGKFLDELAVPGVGQEQEIYSQVFKMLIFQNSKEKEGIKNEIIGFLNKIKNNKAIKQSEDVFKAITSFETLQGLRDGDLDVIQTDIENKVANRANLLKFKYNFPLLFLVTLAKRSSTLTNNVFGQFLKEIESINNVVSAEDAALEKEKYLTSEQKQKPLEKLMMSLYIAINGKTMEMNSIGRAIKKKDPSFDINLLRTIHLCSTNSPSSFKSVIYGLSCAKQLNVLMEMYDVFFFNNVYPVNILRTLESDQEQNKLFMNLVYTLYYILKFELIYNKKKRKAESQKDFSETASNKSGEGGAGIASSDFGTIRKKLLALIPQLRKKLRITELSRHQSFQRIRPVFNAPPQKLNKVRVGENMSSQGSSTLQDEDGGEQLLPGFDGVHQVNRNDLNEDRIVENMIRHIFGNYSNPFVEDQYHMKLWQAILESEKLKKIFTPRVLVVIRCYAIIMLRNDGLLSQDNKDYEKCVNKLAEEIELDYEKLEFLVDIMSGDPMDIFKGTPKQPQYAIKNEEEFTISGQKSKNCFINARFDGMRIQLLADLLSADKNYLPFACLKWYHSHRFFKSSSNQVSLLLKMLGIKSDYHELMEITRMYQNGLMELDPIFIQDKFIKYIERQLTGRKQLAIQPDFYEHTEKVFVTEKDKQNNVMLQDKQEHEIKYIEEIQFLQQNDNDSNGLINIMNQLLDIKKCNRHTLYRVLFGNTPAIADRTIEDKQREHDINILSELLQGIKGPAKPAKSILVVKKLSSLIQAFGSQRQISLKDKNLFVQFALLTNALQLKTLVATVKFNRLLMEQALENIVDLCNNARNEVLVNRLDQIEEIPQESYTTLVQALYSSGYFTEISRELLSILDPEHPRIMNDRLCNAILGVLLGAATNDLEMLRFSVVQMLESHPMNLNLLSGIAASMIGDLKADANIKQLCKSTELDGQFFLNLLDFINPQTQNLPIVLQDLLSYVTKDQAKTCGSLLHIIKKDIGMSPVLAERLSVPNVDFVPILAATLGDFDILPEQYPYIAKKFGFENYYSAQYILELTHCKTSCLDELKRESTKNFLIAEPDLAKSIFTITHNGKQFLDRNYDTFVEARNVGNSFSIIGKKLGQELFLHKQHAADLTLFTSIIIPACWNSIPALNDTLVRLRNLPANSFWSKDFKVSAKNAGLSMFNQAQVQAFLHSKLRKVGEEFALLRESIVIKQKSMLTLLKSDILEELREKIDNQISGQAQGEFQEKVWQAADSFYQQIKPEGQDRGLEFLNGQGANMKRELVAYKIGCTYSTSLQKKFKQPYFLCETCDPEDSVIICVTCALFCHKGHKIKEGNYGEPSKVTCHCGEGKFNNCPTLNDNNPLPDCKGAKNCKLVKNSIKVIQDKAIKEVFVKGDIKSLDDLYKIDENKQLTITDTEDNYTSFELIRDLNRAFRLPNYFSVDERNYNQCPPAADLHQKKLLTFRNGNAYLKDSYLNFDVSLTEQIIMIAYGQTSQSLVSILSGSKGYNYTNYQLQQLHPDDLQPLPNLTKYRTLSALASLAKFDFTLIQEFGQSLLEAMQENSEDSIFKLMQLVRLCKGGVLPQLRGFEDQQIKPTAYIKLMQRLFGAAYSRVLSIHILLQQGKKNLLRSLGIDRSKPSGLSSTIENQNNIRDWTDQFLFKQTLQLENKPNEYVKHVIGLLCNSMESFDFVLKEKKIHPAIAAMYKALIKKDEKELAPIFESVKKMIPTKFNQFMIKVWLGDKQQVILFIIKFLVQNTQFIKSWENISVEEKLSQKQEQQKEYLTILYELMCEDDFGKEQSISYVLNRVQQKSLVQTRGNADQQAILNKASWGLKCISAVFYGSVVGVQEIAHAIYTQDELDKQEVTFNEWRQKYHNLVAQGMGDALARSKLTRTVPANPRKKTQGLIVEEYIPRPPAMQAINSLALIINGDWDTENLKTILDSLEVTSYFHESLPLGYLENFIDACQGDLVALGRIEDEIIRGGNSHLRSLMASFITGTTKFDNLESNMILSLPAYNQMSKDEIETKLQKSKNLLLREMYRIFEKLISGHNKWVSVQREQVNQVIAWCFEQKVPLHLCMVFKQDVNFINKLFKPEDEYLINTSGGASKDDLQEHIMKLFDFFDPFNKDANSITKLLENVCFKENLASIPISKIPALSKFLKIDPIKDLNLKLQFQERNEQIKIDPKDDAITVRQKKIQNQQIKLYQSLKADLGLVNSKDHISINLIAFTKMLSGAYQLDSLANQNLFQVFIRLFDNDIILQNLYTLIYKVVTKQKVQVLDCLSSVTALIISSTKMKELDGKDKDIIMMISKWLHVSAILLDKEKKFSEMDDQVKQTIKEALDYTIKCADAQASGALMKYKDDLLVVVDIVFGIMSLCKHDFKKIRSIAIKVGGFPSIQKLESFFYMVKKNKDVLNFGSGIIGNVVGQVTSALPAPASDQLPAGGSIAMDPRAIFNHFAKKGQGKINMEDFAELVKYMGLNLSQAEQLQIFSKVDTDKSGDLNFAQFLRSFVELRKKVILQALTNLGLTIADLVRTFVISVVILILMFVFIFVSINAFSSASTFSSVTNSLLPIVAGGAASKAGSKNKDDDESHTYEEAIDEVLK